MSDVITINTSDGIVQRKSIEPLPLYGENLPLLSEVMPEYTGPVPSPFINNIAERMKLTMKNFNGLGLSANQCGVKLRAFVIGTDQFQIFCVNPKIIGESAEKVKENEGCLSFPGLFCKIERPKSIDVEFVGQDGEVKQMNLTGVTARCFQHELDHLNGIKFVEHIGPVALQMARKKQSKLIKRATRK